jgi:hypothetical protein
MAGGDVSGCLEVSSGYGNLTRFNSGKFGVSFDSTGGADERIWGKDPTVDATKSVLYVDAIQLAACASGGNVALIDGSGGSPLVTLANSDVSYGGGVREYWDFRDDPLVCLTADNTQSLCVSSTLSGHISGFVKCWWGPLL